MPVLPAAPGVIKCTYSGFVAAVPWTNIHHFHYDGVAPTDADLDAAANGMLGSWITNFQPIYPTGVVLSSILLEDLSGGAGAVGGEATPEAGTNGGGGVTGSVCILAKHLIARRYRGGHPRTYLVGTTLPNLVTPDQWSSSHVAIVQGAFIAQVADTITAMNWTGSGTKTYVSVSYFTAHAPRVAPVVDPILGTIVENKVATQRRRIGR